MLRLGTARRAWPEASVGRSGRSRTRLAAGFSKRSRRRGPLVLLFEDLHWADPALFDLRRRASSTGHAACRSSSSALLGRSSSNVIPSWGGGTRNATTVSLTPLTAEEIARLISALLSRAVLPAETRAALLERAGGNPLYAEEFVRMLSDQGVVTEQGELVGNGEIALPESVHALIAARLDTLAPERKALLHDASVVGKVFWPGAVASVGGTDKGAVRERLRELVRKELVRPARSSSVEGEDEFLFWHALVRDVAYGQIPRASRAEKHRAAAEWIEQTAGERVADHAELIAHHYLQALELARAATAATRPSSRPVRRAFSSSPGIARSTSSRGDRMSTTAERSTSSPKAPRAPISSPTSHEPR